MRGDGRTDEPLLSPGAEDCEAVAKGGAVATSKPSSCCRRCCELCCPLCCSAAGAEKKWCRCGRCSLLAAFVLLIVFYLVLPAVLAAVLGAATIRFDSVSMSHNYTTMLQQQQHAKLQVFARASLVGLSSPLDVGIRIRALSVFHHRGRLGTLFPHSEIYIPRRSIGGGNFSLNADLRIDDFPQFHDFAHQLLAQDTVSWQLRTDVESAVVRLHLPFFSATTYLDICIPNVRFSKTIAMKGCAGFPDTKIGKFTLDDLPPVYPTPGPGLNVHVSTALFNPSAANVSDMGTVSFNMIYDPKADGDNCGLPKASLGTLRTATSFSIVPGKNQFHAIGRFTAQGPTANFLIERYLNGTNSTMTALAPIVNASSDPVFSRFLGGLSITTTLYGTPRPLIVAGVMIVDGQLLDEILTHKAGGPPILVPTQVMIRNSFSALMTITEMSFDIIYNKSIVGHAVHNGTRVMIPPNSSSWVPPLQLVANITDPKVSATILSVVKRMMSQGHVYTGLRGNFSFETGGLHFEPKHYVQLDSVPSCLGFGSKDGRANWTCPKKAGNGTPPEAAFPPGY
jgi:hypothetical protein